MFNILIWCGILIFLIVVQVISCKLPTRTGILKVSWFAIWSIMSLTYAYAIYQCAAKFGDASALTWGEGFNSDFLPSLTNISQWSIEYKLLVGIGVSVGIYVLISTFFNGIGNALFLLCLQGEGFLIANGYLALTAWWGENFSYKFLALPITLILGFLPNLWLILTYLLPFAAFRAAHPIAFETRYASGSSTVKSDYSDDSFDLAGMPSIIYDDNNKQWYKQYDRGNYVVYGDNNGNTVDIYNAHISGSSANTDKGSFHWY